MTGNSPAGKAGAVDIATIGPNFGLAVRLLDLRMMKRAGEAFSRLGLTPAAATALLVIQANPGVRHGELADALFVQRPNMTKLLKQMVDEGLLRRGGSDGDRRHVMFSLTPAGKRLATRVETAMRSLDDLMFAGFTDAERAGLQEAIEKLTRAADGRASASRAAAE